MTRTLNAPVSGSNYRRDIDGLRALAVLPVIAYHAGLPGFGAGFVGVDIFFVISGFLISGIIIDAHERGAFSYRQFYARRARRLLPALFVVLLATFVVSYFVLLPEDFQEFSQSSIWAMLFGSNFFFLKTVNYFSQAAEFMPALHTWSLAVEEQFYLIWPPVLAVYLWLTQRVGWIKATLLLVVPIVLSFAAAVGFQEPAPDHVFYMTWFRLWELGAGALAAVLIRRWDFVRNSDGKVPYAIGAAMVLIAMFVLDSVEHGLVYHLLPVCLGTALMLLFGGAHGNWMTVPLSSTIPVSVGRISYGLYLWHWPVFALFRVYQMDTELARSDALWLTALTFVLATISFFLIEHPIRRKLAPSPAFVATSVLGVAVLAAAFLGFRSDGFQHRVGNSVDYVASREVMLDWKCPKRVVPGLGARCVYGTEPDKARGRILLWGDSHARHLSPIIEKVAHEENLSIILYRTCAPFVDHVDVEYLVQGEGHSKQCGLFRKRVINWLNSDAGNVDGILIASAWAGYRRELRKPGDAAASPNGPDLVEQGLRSMLSSIGSNVPVLLLSDVARPGKTLVSCAYEALPAIWRRSVRDVCQPMPLDRVRNNHTPTTDVLKRLADDLDNVTALDLVENMCDDKGCPLFVEGRLLYRDHNHIRVNLTDTEIETLARLTGIRDAMRATLVR